MKIVKVNKRLKMDAELVCKSIYKANAPHAIGYLFNESLDGKSVANGMFCDYKDEINPDRWTYFYDYFHKIFYEI